VIEHAPYGPFEDEAAVARWIREAIAYQDAEPRVNYQLAMVLKETGELFGTCWLGVRDARNRLGAIGCILAKSAWGKGYASEAAHELMRFGFRILGLHRIAASTSPKNMSSQRGMEKLGMRREGYAVKSVLLRGEWRDSVLYAILEDEFRD
jgi:RimJ/RimL family protein N-acetyltransferase